VLQSWERMEQSADLASSRAVAGDLARHQVCVYDPLESDRVRRPLPPRANCCHGAYSPVHGSRSHHPYYKRYVRRADSWHWNSYLVDGQ
jgi:hypothetical protein